MPSFTTNYLRNIFRLLRRDLLLDPLVATYYLTTRCNLNCVYCEDFGLSRNEDNLPPLSLDQAQHVLKVIRTGIDRVILTGGEPLLFSEIVDLLEYCSQRLKFAEITMLSNGLLLREREQVLQYLDRLVISLDSPDPEFWQGMIRSAPGTAHKIMENIQYAATLQRRHHFSLIVNCVLSPNTLPGVKPLLDFCADHSILISFSPQSVGNWPAYDLLVSQQYRDVLSEILRRKNQGGPILGSSAYYQLLQSFTPYACYPTLVPRVWPDGSLIYPCRPIEREGGSRGGRPVNLCDVHNWHDALQHARKTYGSPPETCASCFQQCFAEPSLMQAFPLQFLGEWLRYSPSRRGSLATFAPG